MRRQGLIFGLDATQILLVFLVPFVAFWTARTALARNRNPWLWGGAAFVLGIPWPGINLPILGVVPVLFLMFFVRPTAPGNVEPRNACSKCASSHPPGQNFCTKCGWDLSREYSAETADTVLASEMHQHQASPTTMERTTETATQDPFGTAPSTPDEDLLSATGNDQYEAPVTGMPTGEPVAEGTPAFASEKLQPEAEFHPDPEQQSRPWGMPVPGPSPTAEGMTARGEVLLSEGKLQEAIDQFTKAIALNPKHREAFERRAEAYSRQGRQERADEDYRQFQALNTGS